MDIRIENSFKNLDKIIFENSVEGKGLMGVAIATDEADIEALANAIKNTVYAKSSMVVVSDDPEADNIITNIFKKVLEDEADEEESSTAKSNRSAWTAEEDAILKAKYTVNGYKGCADKLPGRTRDAITSRARKLGLRVTGKAETPVSTEITEEPTTSKEQRVYTTASKTMKGCYDATNVPGKDVLLRDEESGLIYIGTRPHTCSYYNVCCIDPSTARKFYKEVSKSKSTSELKTLSGKRKFSVDKRDLKLYTYWNNYMDMKFEKGMALRKIDN